MKFFNRAIGIYFYLAMLALSCWADDKPLLNNLTLAPVLKQTMPAIVNVAVQGIIQTPIESNDDEDNTPNQNPNNSRLMPEKPRKFQSIGSGVILDQHNGIVVTNDHVIRHANLITVTLNDGRRLKAKLIGSDSETDLAVLKIESNEQANSTSVII